MSHEPLRITLEDLHSAETKGKWWLVGAAWNGDPLVDRKTASDQAKEKKPLNDEDELIRLAKKQGMNTEIRRSIFVIIMSSEVRATAFIQGQKG
jgi:nucleolar MIF4G domain-containing protein 1